MRAVLTFAFFALLLVVVHCSRDGYENLKEAVLNEIKEDISAENDELDVISENDELDAISDEDALPRKEWRIGRGMRRGVLRCWQGKCTVRHGWRRTNVRHGWWPERQTIKK